MVLGGEFDFSGGFESPLGLFFGYLKLLVLTLATFRLLIAAVETDVASKTRNTSYPAFLISPIASAIRSDRTGNRNRVPYSCIRRFNGSST